MAKANNNQNEQDHNSAILTLENVAKDFGGLRAIDDVSIQVKPGERRAIIGPNGAGKTTLFNLITGELPVTSGRILLSGKDITKMSAHRRTGVGLGRTYQITNIFPGLTVQENVQLAAQGLSATKFSLHPKYVIMARLRVMSILFWADRSMNNWPAQPAPVRLYV